MLTDTGIAYTQLLDDFCAAVAQDLTQLAVLHDTEADKPLIQSLQQTGFPASLGMKLESKAAHEALVLVEKALAGLSDTLDEQHTDELAVDYAGIYLTHVYRASPNESVWVDEEHLERQQSMFEVREYYTRYGLGAANWRKRADDHLVLQLQFLAHLIGEEQRDEAFTTAARFMDEHLLRWLMPFANRVAGRCATPFYAGINLLTGIYCEELRDILAVILGERRPTADEIEAHMQQDKPVSVDVPMPFIPGAGGPSW
ncbi:MAG: molecular chaperone TorD family protein [Pseudomonadota bacterium]